MLTIVKYLARTLPSSILLELKRFHYARQATHGDFSADEKEYDLLHTWLSEGDWAIDVGANIGQYTKKMSDIVGNSGRVIAFEPVLETFYLLASNVIRFKNKVNVTLVNAAISDKMEVLGMDMPKLKTGLDNYYKAHLVDAENGRTVLCVPIDDFHFPQKIKLVKIDAEGHELYVIRGMQNILKRDHPVLIVEDNGDDYDSYLKIYGYKKQKLMDSPNLIFM